MRVRVIFFLKLFEWLMPVFISWVSMLLKTFGVFVVVVVVVVVVAMYFVRLKQTSE